METFLGSVGATAALLLALGVIGRYALKGFMVLRSAFHMIDTIETLVSRELEHNHGSSLKDDVYGMAVSVGKTQRKVDELSLRNTLQETMLYQLQEQFREHIADKETP